VLVLTCEFLGLSVFDIQSITVDSTCKPRKDERTEGTGSIDPESVFVNPSSQKAQTAALYIDEECRPDLYTSLRFSTAASISEMSSVR
jgi:hypothetical protein